MLQPQAQQQPGLVNNLPVGQHGGQLKVQGIPSFVTQDDFARLWLPIEGVISSQLAGRQAGTSRRLMAAPAGLPVPLQGLSGLGAGDHRGCGRRGGAAGAGPPLRATQ